MRPRHGHAVPPSPADDELLTDHRIADNLGRQRKLRARDVDGPAVAGEGWFPPSI